MLLLHIIVKVCLCCFGHSPKYCNKASYADNIDQKPLLIVKSNLKLISDSLVNVDIFL